MQKPTGPLPTWCQKLNETTEIILEKDDTSWKIWTTVIRDKRGFAHFKFVAKQHTGPTKSAIFTIFADREQYRPKRAESSQGNWFDFSNLTKTSEYWVSHWIKDQHQYVISVDLVVHDAHRVKSVKEWTDEDYLMTIGDKRFSIHKSISETLGLQFCGGHQISEVELVGVDYDDFITLIDNPESIDMDLTVEKARRFNLMQKKYGIRHNSEKIEKMMEVDFWGDCDDIKYYNVNEVMQPHEPVPEMAISKKYRILSLPNKFTINALGMILDVYFYIQEYNGTSYVSIGVISDKPTDSKYWSQTIGLNIQLHHKIDPLLHKSVSITREFNSYQRSAGCPTFMLSSELGDYCHRDGSYIVSITLSTTDNTSDLQYPGIKDIVLCNGDKKIGVSRDLLLHYCPYFCNFTISDNVSVDNIPIDILLILLDIIYYRSSSQIVDNIQNVLELSIIVQCQFLYYHVDLLLAKRYRSEYVDTKIFDRNWDLPLLREAKRIPMNRRADLEAYTPKLPTDARIVRPLTVNRLLDIILPTKVFKHKNERARLCGQFHAPSGLLKLRQYRMALCTLGGVPQELRVDLQNVYQEIREKDQYISSSVGDGLEAFEQLLGNGGFEELEDEAEKERTIVRDAKWELDVLNSRGKASRRTISKIEEILARNEEDCLEGRRKAAKMFVEKLRKEEGSGKRKKENGLVMDEIRKWAQYLGSLATLQF